MNKRLFREAWVFLAVTLGLNLFVFWGPLALFGIPAASFDGGSSGPAWAVILFIIGGFTPSLVAIFLTLLREGKTGIKAMVRRMNPLSTGLRWHGVILLIMILGAAGQLAIVRLVGASFDFSLFGKRLFWLLPLLILGPLSEELGWRGYALGRLQKRMNAFAASLVVGVFWALWHLPLFYIVGTSQNLYDMSFLAFGAGLLAISVLYTWIYNNCGGSIWSAVFFHWVFTYTMDTMGSGLAPPPAAYHLLQYIPYMAMAIIVLLIWKPKTLTRTHG